MTENQGRCDFLCSKHRQTFPNSLVITGFAKVLREVVFHSTLLSDGNSCISMEYLFLLCLVVLFILLVTKHSFFPVGSC